MPRFVIDEKAFRGLVRGQALAAGGEEVVLIPTLGWVRRVQAILDAVGDGSPAANAIALRSAPPDPPEAREFPPRSRRRE
jgi:hypothetical protein